MCVSVCIYILGSKVGLVLWRVDHVTFWLSAPVENQPDKPIDLRPSGITSNATFEFDGGDLSIFDDIYDRYTARKRIPTFNL